MLYLYQSRLVCCRLLSYILYHHVFSSWATKGAPRTIRGDVSGLTAYIIIKSNEVSMPDQDLKPSQEEVGRSVHLRSCCHDLNIINQISIMKPESKQQNPRDLRRRRNRLHSRGCVWPVAWKGTTIDHQEPNEQHQTNQGNIREQNYNSVRKTQSHGLSLQWERFG